LDKEQIGANRTDKEQQPKRHSVEAGQGKRYRTQAGTNRTDKEQQPKSRVCKGWTRNKV